jgi:hypothetical protein
MDTFFQLQNSTDRALDELKKIPLMLRIYWRGTWEKWHAQCNAKGNDPRYNGMVSDPRSNARRKGRNCKWDACDVSASNNSGVPSQVYNYT